MSTGRRLGEAVALEDRGCRWRGRTPRCRAPAARRPTSCSGRCRRAARGCARTPAGCASASGAPSQRGHRRAPRCTCRLRSRPTPTAQSNSACFTRAARVARGVDARVELLVDARHRRHEVRARRREVVGERVDAARERRRRPRGEPEVLDHARERVRQRQEEEVDVALARDAERAAAPRPPRGGCRASAARPSAARSCPRCRRWWRGRRGASAADAPLDLRARRRAGGAGPRSISPASDAVAASPPSIDHDGARAHALADAVELEAFARARASIFARCFVVLDEARSRFRVGDDVAALGGEVRRIDRHRERAAGEDREVDLHPLRRASPTRSATRSPGATPRSRSPAASVAHAAPPSAAHVTSLPDVAAPVAVARPVRERAGPVEEHLRQAVERASRPPRRVPRRWRGLARTYSSRDSAAQGRTTERRPQRMSELRRDPILRRWVIIAPERGRRDRRARGRRPASDAPDGPCPFCPGNEHLNPRAIAGRRRRRRLARARDARQATRSSASRASSAAAAPACST